jgi:hypothetical protein
MKRRGEEGNNGFFDSFEATAGLGKSSRESESLFAYVGLASHEDSRSRNREDGLIAIRMSRDRPIHP